MKNSIILSLLFCAFMAFAQEKQSFTLMSSTLGGQASKAEEFNGFGCSGQNLSPQLLWANAPKGTKSFAISIHDPDAPTGSGWWHWLAFDIPKDVFELPSGAGSLQNDTMPKSAIQSLTDFGTPGYGGPCPPKGHGIHQYTITVYALKTEKLGLDATANPATVGFYLWSNTIEKASIVMYYQRK